MSETIAIVDTAPRLYGDQRDSISYVDKVVMGLRTVGDNPLDLPGYKPTGTISEQLISIPDSQLQRLREFYSYFYCEPSEIKDKVWDCHRFAGYVALGTPLDVSANQIIEQELDDPSTPAEELESGVAYVAIAGSVGLHSTIGLGNGESIGVKGAWQNLVIQDNDLLAKAYSADAFYKVTSAKFTLPPPLTDTALLGRSHTYHMEAAEPFTDRMSGSSPCHREFHLAEYPAMEFYKPQPLKSQPPEIFDYIAELLLPPELDLKAMPLELPNFKSIEGFDLPIKAISKIQMIKALQF